MEKYHNTIQEKNGDVVTTATVTVYDAVSGLVIALYSDDEVTTLSNPFTLIDANYDTNGAFWFKAPNGIYNIKVVNGTNTTWLYDVTLLDFEDATPLNFDDKTADPTINDDDVTIGAEYGSRWINRTTKEAFRCTDPSTGAAVWIETTLEIGELGTIATQDSDSVNISGGVVAGLTSLTVLGDVNTGGDVNGRTIEVDGIKLDDIEPLADVTDADNVEAAGAVMESDATTAAMSFVVDEDDMISDSATKVATQQSVKKYVDDNIITGGGSNNVIARNKVQNQEPITQGLSSRSGNSSTIHTGNGISQAVVNGVDMATGDLGGLVWLKCRNLSYSHFLTDSVRGVSKNLDSAYTTTEQTNVNGMTSFNSNGFSLGNHVNFNSTPNTFISWSFQTTKKTTGLTNRNKAYTCHYNPDTNFSIVGYVGDGVDGHEIPHHLGVVPELSIFKSRDAVSNWTVQSSLFGLGDYLSLNLTDALSNAASVETIFSNSSISLSSGASINGSTENLIAYHFASKSGVCKIGKYIGTGATGNYVSTEVDGGDAFKPQFILYKPLSSVGDWVLIDAMRVDKLLQPNSSNAESSLAVLDFVDDGIVLTSATGNVLNDEYLFMAFAESSIDATKALTDYNYATTPDTLSIPTNTLVSVANGFDSNGQVDTQYQFGSGITKSYGVGHEDKHYYLYTSKAGLLGESEVRPLTGITRNDADKYGVVSPSDETLRTTAKHFDYESESGIALASGEDGTEVVYNLFNTHAIAATTGFTWRVASTTNSWVQYKHTEPRILKSWRMKNSAVAARTPLRFTVEGSNDGLNWTAIDSSYTASDYPHTSINLWGDLQDTSANTTAHLYHRMNITLNNGDVTYTQISELELNTVIASDYYLVEEGKTYNSAGVPIERVYLGEFKTDSDGAILNETIINYPIAEQETGTLQVHTKLVAHGEFIHAMACTAMLRFDGTQNPPLEKVNEGGLFIVDVGTGRWEVFVPEGIDLYEATVSAISSNIEYVTSVIRRSGKHFEVRCNRPSTLLYYDDTIEIQIFGGKS